MNTMNRVALVTGLSRGIGRAVAAQLAREGYAVGINYYERRIRPKSLSRSLNGRAAARSPCRQTFRSVMRSTRWSKRVEEAFGPISVLVNNAGVAGQALFQDVTDALWERYFAVNLNGAQHHSGRSAAYAARKGRRDRQHFLHLGPARRELRGDLFLHEARAHWSHALTRDGACSPAASASTASPPA